MAESPNTVLLIADISGYTKFMKQHAISVTHAKQIIVRLLKALMQTAKPPLKVAELEGDAVFFYARVDKGDAAAIAQQVKDQIMTFFSAFKKEISVINSLTSCACDACTHISDLQLKQVVHAGNVEVEKIAQFEKLFGLDVIVVHRMLKNSVPENEYVMMSDVMYECCTDFYGLQPKRFKESFEGVGDVETLVFFPKQLTSVPVPSLTAEVTQPTVADKFRWRFVQTVGTLANWAGLTRFKGKFKSVPA